MQHHMNPPHTHTPHIPMTIGRIAQTILFISFCELFNGFVVGVIVGVFCFVSFVCFSIAYNKRRIITIIRLQSLVTFSILAAASNTNLIVFREQLKMPISMGLCVRKLSLALWADQAKETHTHSHTHSSNRINKTFACRMYSYVCRFDLSAQWCIIVSE